MELDFVYALDDSCQVKIYARGHQDLEEFLEKMKAFYFENFEKEVEIEKDNVKNIYWRNVNGPESIVSDRQYIESEQGRGAFPVTLYDFWLPMR